MNYSEIINIVVSVVSIFIALLALFQTKKQIYLSNKQRLFDRRLTCYTKFNTIYVLYTENKLYLKKDDTFCSTNDLIFSWLTNCADLEEMTLAVFNPLHKEEHKIFLTKYERLKNFSIEISVVFNGDAATIAEEFVSQFAELLKAMYKQQIYITDIRKEEKRAGMPKYLTDYQNGCKERAESLGIFQKRDRLAELSEEIENKRIIEQMKKSLCLAKAKR